MANFSFLHSEADHQVLGMVRCTVYGIWLVLILNTPIDVYAYLPVESFSTWGVYQLFFMSLSDPVVDLIFTSEFLTGLKWLLLFCCVLCMVGIRPWIPVAVFTLMLILLFDSIVRGYYGFTNHAQIAVLLCTIILTLFPASDGLSILGITKVKRQDNFYIAPLLFMAVCLSLPYSFIGVHRVIYGGVDIFTGDVLLRFVAVQGLNFSGINNTLGLDLFQYKLFDIAFKTGFVVITIFEILSPLILVSNRFRYMWLAVIVPLHFATLLTMNIFFWENLILILVLFTGLPYLIKKVSFDKNGFSKKWLL